MINRTIAIFTVLALVGVGCRSAEVTGDHNQPVEQPAQKQVVTRDAIPAGTDLRVELNQKLSTKTSQKGDQFTANLLNPLVTAGGEAVVPAGATVVGRVTGLKGSSHVGEQAAIRLSVERIQFEGQSYPLAANIVDTKVKTKRNAGNIGKGAAIGGVAGAVLGGVIGGSLKGALIGGALGAGTGTVISLGTGNVAAELPAGSEMTLRTTQRVPLNE